jgi:F0F1-type ATP synthase membrane subunit b/b'
MSLNEIKEKLMKDSDEKTREIMDVAKKEANQIIKDAEKVANEIERKAKEDAAEEARNMQVKYESEMDFEKNKEIRLAREHVIELEIEKIRPVFIKEMQKQMQPLLSSGIRQMLKTLPENEICIDISKKMVAANPALKKYSLNYKEQDSIVIHDKEYKIKIIIDPDDIFNKNIDVVKQAIAKELFGKKKENKKNNAMLKPKKQKKHRV